MNAASFPLTFVRLYAGLLASQYSEGPATGHLDTGFPLDAGLLARNQYSEGPATGHLNTGFSWFPCVCKRMPRWFPTLQVATACFSCSLPDLYFIFMYM
jgi:hypothetical protein